MTTDFEEKTRCLRNAVEPVAHAAYAALGFEVERRRSRIA
jgi:hypothetical protein